MSEGCIVIHPATRDEGMRREAAMGLSARDAVDEVDSVDTTNRSLQRARVPLKVHVPGSPRQVTDGSDASDYTKSGLQTLPTSERQTKVLPTATEAGETNAQDGEKADEEGESGGKATIAAPSSLTEPPKRSQANNVLPAKRGFGSLQRSGPTLQEEQSSSSVAVVESTPQHEQLEEVEPLDISYVCTPGTLKVKSLLLSRLADASPNGLLQVVDLSRRGLGSEDAELITRCLKQNPQLAVLKLGYNNLGDEGTTTIATSFAQEGRFHRGLSVLDLGFNGIGDQGATVFALHALAGNHALKTLFLSGNNIGEKGAVALAGAVLHGCSLNCLHLSANKLGPVGLKVVAGAVAEAEARRLQLLQRRGGIILSVVQPVGLEELHLNDISMGTQGFVSLPTMLLANASLKLLCLSNNDLDDRDIALFSQAISQNKSIPLVSLRLSFNKITCVGVECLMNAIWGSQTLREIKLDNNKVQDRGAQLCSVVLGAVQLEILDLGFNRVSTVGIKAIMKSLSENDTLRSLSMSGIPMDQNASKAVSYALAYNCSLQAFNVDSCCVGYSGQRHIVAGIVSNRKMQLRNLTGFPLGPITKTLGVPQLPEDWGNSRVLSFMRFMWAHWRASNPNGVDMGDVRGPAPPATVAASAKRAFSALSGTEQAKLQFEQQMTQPEPSQVLPHDATILERSLSGNLQVPDWNELGTDSELGTEAWSSETDSLDRSSYSDSSQCSVTAPTVDPVRRNKNLQWLRAHFQSLNEVGNLPFNNADLWQLHQYFFSPVYSTADDSEVATGDEVDAPPHSTSPNECAHAPPSTPVVSDGSKQSNLGRAISFQTLGEAVAAAAVGVDASGPNKRRSVDGSHEEATRCAKRAKNLKPRIAYYPRIREKLESLGTKPSGQTLSLLRQLKYIESVMLQGRNVYTDDEVAEGPNASDVEMIILDLL